MIYPISKKIINSKIRSMLNLQHLQTWISMDIYWYVVLPVQVWTLIRNCWILSHQLDMVLFEVTFGKEKGLNTPYRYSRLILHPSISRMRWTSWTWSEGLIISYVSQEHAICSGGHTWKCRIIWHLQLFSTFNKYLQRVLCDLLLGLAPKSLMKTQLWNHTDFGPWPETETVFVERMVKVCFVFGQTVNPKGLRTINPLNAELNLICYLLALLAHHFLIVSRVRVKSLTLRLLMSYIYIYIYIYVYIYIYDINSLRVNIYFPSHVLGLHLYLIPHQFLNTWKY